MQVFLVPITIKVGINLVCYISCFCVGSSWDLYLFVCNARTLYCKHIPSIYNTIYKCSVVPLDPRSCSIQVYMNFILFIPSFPSVAFANGCWIKPYHYGKAWGNIHYWSFMYILCVYILCLRWWWCVAKVDTGTSIYSQTVACLVTYSTIVGSYLPIPQCIIHALYVNTQCICIIYLLNLG